MNASPDLTVVIPLYNAEDSIESLTSSILGIDALTCECIIVDDASTDNSPTILRRLDSEHAAVSVVHQPENQGAGVARNVGFERARGRYTLFFDADDVLHPDAAVTAVETLDHTGSTLAMLPYRYRRGVVVPHEDMNEHDIVLWERFATGTVTTLALREAAELLGFTNYPWNKVLRTEHYRQSGLTFSATPIHNDILGHWHSLLFADSIDLVDSPVCTHIVTAGGTNLSNRASRDRLALIDALDDTYDLLAGHPDLRSRYAHHYWPLAVRVSRWARSRIDPAHLDEFNSRWRRHVTRLSVADLASIRSRRSPALADSLYEEATR